MGEPSICIGENKGADQLHSNCEADRRLRFRYMDILSWSGVSGLWPSSALVQLGLCRTRSEATLLVLARGGSLSTRQRVDYSNV